MRLTVLTFSSVGGEAAARDLSRSAAALETYAELAAIKLAGCD
ncbi:hypothetical protein [Nitrospira sp. BLG_2]